MESSPPHSLRDITAALGALPLFPLPQTVLFPGALLPLHIFEPRYRTMIREVIDSHGTLAIVHIRDAEALDAHGNPAIEEVAGVGVIVDKTELPGGKYNIMVQGRARVKLTELPFVPPYRRASAVVLPSMNGELPHVEITALLTAANAFASLIRERDSAFEFRLPHDAAPGLLADLCAHHLVLDARERQALLETLDVPARVRRCAEVLALQRGMLGPHSRESLN